MKSHSNSSPPIKDRLAATRGEILRAVLADQANARLGQLSDLRERDILGGGENLHVTGAIGDRPAPGDGGGLVYLLAQAKQVLPDTGGACDARSTAPCDARLTACDAAVAPV